jgi:hypothetical protein
MATENASPASGGSPVLAAGARGLVRLLYTHNPFYLLSAWFVFTGLRISFDPRGEAYNTTALMLSLAGYMLLLAFTAWGLIRLGQVWQDVRSILLLILVMFVAVSVLIDDVLAASFQRGAVCYLIGLAFCSLLTEVLLRSLPIRLPALYRLPYDVLLSLLFLYPLALMPFASRPYGAAMQWGLYAFPLIAAAVLLLLIPATRQGPGYVNDNGTPWRWPLYPWTVFFFLVLGIGWRSYSLCISLHHVGGMGTIFAPSFLMPLWLAICVLLLEMGLVTGNRRVQQTAMLLPLIGCGLLSLPIGGGFVHDRFLELFFRTLGATPFFYALLATLLFYGFAAWRRVPHAADWVTVGLAAWAMVNYNTADLRSLWDPWGAPLLGAALLQLGLALTDRSSPRALLAASAMCLAGAIDLQAAPLMAYDGLVLAHLWLAAVLAIGLLFKDEFADFLQAAGAWLLMGATIVAVTSGIGFRNLPEEVLFAYPLATFAVSVAYYWLTRHPLHAAAAVAAMSCWLVTSSVQFYYFLKPLLAGLDKLVWGLIFFLCAAIISLLKSGRLQRWLDARRSRQLSE